MIWVSTYLSWSLVDQTLFYGQRKGPLLPLAMLGLVVFITVTYMVNDNPVFHQVGACTRVSANAAYATIFGATVLHGIYVLFASTSPLNTNDAARRARADARYLQLVGTVTVLPGFLIWNIDNVFCGTLRAARDAIGYPWAVLLEGHGWWHILTGYGAYLLLVSCEVIVLAHMEHPANICVRYGVMPYVRRVRDNDPRRLLLDEYRARKLN